LLTFLPFFRLYINDTPNFETLKANFEKRLYMFRVFILQFAADKRSTRFMFALIYSFFTLLRYFVNLIKNNFFSLGVPSFIDDFIFFSCNVKDSDGNCAARDSFQPAHDRLHMDLYRLLAVLCSLHKDPYRLQAVPDRLHLDLDRLQAVPDRLHAFPGRLQVVPDKLHPDCNGDCADRDGLHTDSLILHAVSLMLQAVSSTLHPVPLRLHAVPLSLYPVPLRLHAVSSGLHPVSLRLHADPYSCHPDCDGDHSDYNNAQSVPGSFRLARDDIPFDGDCNYSVDDNIHQEDH
jgi:hypothetical protein